MFDGVEKKPGSTWRHIGLAVFGLIVAATFGYMAILGITHQNSVADESAQQEIEVEDAAVSAALSELAFTDRKSVV